MRLPSKIPSKSIVVEVIINSNKNQKEKKSVFYVFIQNKTKQNIGKKKEIKM